ncbi:MAG: hypothetical protein KIS78_17470 [Labilithrix sp.]|nr:hypothetical protein [Labilithrix sp.]
MTSRRPRVRDSLRRLFVFASTLAAVFFVTTGASAQFTINVVNELSLPRLDKDSNVVSKRPQTLSPEGVSLQDCVDDQKIRFTLQMSGYEPRAVIEAWASIGQDCKAQTARNAATQVCWRVFDAAIPLSPVIDVDIPVRKIMSGAPPNRPLEPDATEAVCGKVDLANIGVHFLYFAPGDPVTAQIDKSVTVTVDTVGPAPPSGLTALPGNGRITVRWTNISGGADDAAATGGLTELTGVKVYCDVAGGASTETEEEEAEPVCRDEPVDAGFDDADAAIDAGTVRVCEDAGSSTEAPSSDECSSANFVDSDGASVLPTAEFDAKYKCGEVVGNTGTSAVATQLGNGPLLNGTSYAVAVASTDRFGNVGELSSVVCQTPELTTDFWEDYRKAGGGAGGCTTNGSELPLGSMTTMFVGVALAISTLRRRTTQRRDRLR